MLTNIYVAQYKNMDFQIDRKKNYSELGFNFNQFNNQFYCFAFCFINI